MHARKQDGPRLALIVTGHCACVCVTKSFPRASLYLVAFASLSSTTKQATHNCHHISLKMLFSWANKQLEKLSETMAPLSNSATGQFIQALQNNDIQTAKSLLSTDENTHQNHSQFGVGNEFNGFGNNSYQQGGAYHSGGVGMNIGNGSLSMGMQQPQQPATVNPHSTTFHPQKQSKAIHITCQYSNTLSNQSLAPTQSWQVQRK